MSDNRISIAQRQAMLEFIKLNPKFLTEALTTTMKAQFGFAVNAVIGPKKTPDQVQVSFRDWRKKVIKKQREINQLGTGGGNGKKSTLSDIDKDLLLLLAQHNVGPTRLSSEEIPASNVEPTAAIESQQTNENSLNLLETNTTTSLNSNPSATKKLINPGELPQTVVDATNPTMQKVIQGISERFSATMSSQSHNLRGPFLNDELLNSMEQYVVLQQVEAPANPNNTETPLIEAFNDNPLCNDERVTNEWSSHAPLDSESSVVKETNVNENTNFNSSSISHVEDLQTDGGNVIDLTDTTALTVSNSRKVQKTRAAGSKNVALEFYKETESRKETHENLMLQIEREKLKIMKRKLELKEEKFKLQKKENSEILSCLQRIEQHLSTISSENFV